jgi:hypothetical protein
MIIVTPTKVGVQLWALAKRSWIPAFAGMTLIEACSELQMRGARE